MRRAIVAIVSTAAGTAVLLGAKGGLGFADEADKAPAKAAGTPKPSMAASAPAAAAPPVMPGSQAPVMPGKTTAPGAQKTQPAPANPPPAADRMKDGNWLGREVDSGFGPVQVRIKVTGGKMESITTVKEPNGQSESARISRNAFPKLARQALAEQSAEVDTVSGATETCEAYKESLQSAMDAAYLAS